MFRDDKGREWVVRFDHALLLDIRKRLGVDLHNMDQQAQAIGRIADGDVELLANILYLACEAQCAQQGMSDEDFGRGLAEGETIDRAALALQEAILSFTTPRRRELVKRAMSATLGIRETAGKLVTLAVAKAIHEAEKTAMAGV